MSRIAPLRAIPLVMVAVVGCAVADALVAHGSAAASPVAEVLDVIEARLRESRRLAVVAAPLLMVVVAIVPVPAELPAMLNGVLFGPVLGTAVTWGGAMTGAWISYELARALGRPAVERFVDDRHLARAERVAEAAGAPALLALRLTPVVAFTAVNWLSGLCGVRRRTFLWTTAVGIVPGAIAFTASGTGLAALYTVDPVTSLVIGMIVVLLVVTLARRRRTRPGS